LDEQLLLVHAYLDGELDPANALAVERLIAADPLLAAERERIEALKQLILEKLPREAAPPDLRARVEASIGLQQRAPSTSWRALAASIALTALLASGSTWLLLGERASDTAGAIVDNHIRALMAPEATDVTSTDRHTVKPWFNGRIPQSPRVIDLASSGFPLIGGRVDVISRNPVPTLVFRRAKHVISLTEISADSSSNAAPAHSSIHGYNLVQWTADGVAYWAVSDVATPDLDQFVRLLRETPPEQ
jgi:anti-sigma factor RsiW